MVTKGIGAFGTGAVAVASIIEVVVSIAEEVVVGW